MINKYIERHIKRKIVIVEFLFESVGRDLELEILREKLCVSKPTLNKDFFFLKDIFGQKIEMCLKKEGNIFIKSIDISLESAYQCVYRYSDFLNMLSFILLNDFKGNLKKYIEDRYCSRAKVYMEKKKVFQYLQECKINDAEDFKKILLLAKLETEYGIVCVPSYVAKLYDSEINSILTTSLRLSISTKRKLCVIALLLISMSEINIDVSEIEKNFILNICYFSKQDKEIIKKVSSYFKKQKKIKENLFSLFYKVVSTNLYLPGYMPNEYLNLFLKNETIKSIIEEFQIRFGKKLVHDTQFLGVLFNCIKGLTLEVSEFLLPKEFECLSKSLYYQVFNAVKEWKEKQNECNFILNSECLIYLSNKVFTILKKEEKLKLYVYSDSFLEYLEIFQNLEKNLSVNAEIIDFWVYSFKQIPLIKGVNKIIITDIKHYGEVQIEGIEILYYKFPIAFEERKMLNEQLLDYIDNYI